MAETGCLRDASVQNIQISGRADIEGTAEVRTSGGVLMSGGSGINRTTKNVNRYYLEEFFKQRPALNAVAAYDMTGNDGADQTALVAAAIANKDFEALGTNATTALVTFSSTRGGITLTTAGADNDQIIIAPHLDTNATAWSGAKWGTENQVEWECSLTTDASIADVAFWAGLKLTNTPVYATDADQAYFLYASDDDNGALTTNGDLHFVYSVGGTDYISDLGIAVAINTTYHLKVVIDSNRLPTVYVNGTQYSLTSATTAGGVAVSAGSTRGAALTNDIDLIPYVGVQAHAGSAKAIHLSYEAVSRHVYE